MFPNKKLYPSSQQSFLKNLEPEHALIDVFEKSIGRKQCHVWGLKL